MAELPLDSYPPLPLLTHLQLDIDQDEYSQALADVLLQLILHPPSLRSLTFPQSGPEGVNALLHLADSTSLHSPASILHGLEELHLPTIDQHAVAANQLIRILDNYPNIKVLTIPLDRFAPAMFSYWKDNYSTHSHKITTLHFRGDVPYNLKVFDLEVVLLTLQHLTFNDPFTPLESFNLIIDTERTPQLKGITFQG